MRSANKEFSERLEGVCREPELWPSHVGKEVAVNPDLWDNCIRDKRVYDDYIAEHSCGAPVPLQVTLDPKKSIEVIDNTATTAVQ
jgi:hypothetical protein